MLDEATSALSVDVEASIYERCIATGMTLISVGHRTTLAMFHDLVLQLGGQDGAWELAAVELSRGNVLSQRAPQ